MENGSPVRFHVEEQVNLRQKINEADIISLDVKPEIQVLEQDQLVIIKGDLVLSGHFQSPELRTGVDKEELEGATFLPFEAGEVGDQQSTSIWSVTERFPIDITVPAHKVNNLDDVYLHVEQLDYTIDEQNRLNVEVEIALLGVENGLTIDRNWVDQHREQEQTVDSEESEEDLDSPNQQEQEPELDHPVLSGDRSWSDDLSEEERENQLETGQSDDREEAFTTDGSERGYGQEGQGEENLTEQEDEDLKIQTNIRAESTEEETELEEEEKEPREQEEQSSSNGREEASSVGQKVVSFLSKLMAVKEEETSPKATLKMCIVQRNETLEQIAERYQVSVDEIIRFNRLTSDQVSPGDIMYIPFKKKK